MQISTITYKGKPYRLSSLRLGALIEARDDALRMAEGCTDENGKAFYQGRAQALDFAIVMLEETPITH